MQQMSLGAGAIMLAPLVRRVMANNLGHTSTPRFVFVLQSNGFDAIQACPETIPFKPYADRETFETLDLTRHTLPLGIAPLEKHIKVVNSNFPKKQLQSLNRTSFLAWLHE